MPKNETVDHAIKNAVGRVMERMLAAVETQMSRAVAARVAAEWKQTRRGSRGRKNGVTRARPKVAITTWVADRRARRVPNFVIEATGLDTKKRIVAKFGEGVKFEKGKALPKPHMADDAVSKDANGAKAKPPVVRKAAAK